MSADDYSEDREDFDFPDFERHSEDSAEDIYGRPLLKPTNTVLDITLHAVIALEYSPRLDCFYVIMNGNGTNLSCIANPFSVTTSNGRTPPELPPVRLDDHRSDLLNLLALTNGDVVLLQTGFNINDANQFATSRLERFHPTATKFERILLPHLVPARGAYMRYMREQPAEWGKGEVIAEMRSLDEQSFLLAVGYPFGHTLHSGYLQNTYDVHMHHVDVVCRTTTALLRRIVIDTSAYVTHEESIRAHPLYVARSDGINATRSGRRGGGSEIVFQSWGGSMASFRHRIVDVSAGDATKPAALTSGGAGASSSAAATAIPTLQRIPLKTPMSEDVVSDAGTRENGRPSFYLVPNSPGVWVYWCPAVDDGYGDPDDPRLHLEIAQVRVTVNHTDDNDRAASNGAPKLKYEARELGVFVVNLQSPLDVADVPPTFGWMAHWGVLSITLPREAELIDNDHRETLSRTYFVPLFHVPWSQARTVVYAREPLPGAFLEAARALCLLRTRALAAAEANERELPDAAAANSPAPNVEDGIIVLGDVALWASLPLEVFDYLIGAVWDSESRLLDE